MVRVIVHLLNIHQNISTYLLTWSQILFFPPLLSFNLFFYWFYLRSYFFPFFVSLSLCLDVMWKLFFFNAPEISHINTQRYTTKLAYFLHYLWQTQAVRKHHFLSNEEARTETERLFSAVSRISSDFICMPRHFSLPQIPLFLVLLAFFFKKAHYTIILGFFLSQHLLPLLLPPPPPFTSTLLPLSGGNRSSRNALSFLVPSSRSLLSSSDKHRGDLPCHGKIAPGWVHAGILRRCRYFLSQL